MTSFRKNGNPGGVLQRPLPVASWDPWWYLGCQAHPRYLLDGLSFGGERLECYRDRSGMITSSDLSRMFSVVTIQSVGLPWWLGGKESTCSAGDKGSVPESGRSPGGGHGNPLQSWRATVHRVKESWTRMKQLSTGQYVPALGALLK